MKSQALHSTAVRTELLLSSCILTALPDIFPCPPPTGHVGHPHWIPSANHPIPDICHFRSKGERASNESTRNGQLPKKSF